MRQEVIAQISDRGLPSARISLTRFSELLMKIQQILDRQGIVHTDPEIMSIELHYSLLPV